METTTTTQSGGNHVAAAASSAAHANPAHSIKFTVKSAFGCQPTRIDPLVAFSASSGNKDYSDRLLHKVGKQISVFDPETNSQEFFENRPRNVIDVVHCSISSNQRFVAMCEAVRYDKASSDAGSQVSVYSLSTLNRLKTLHHSLPRPYICATFCGDPKLVAALSDEPDRHIVIWQWEKEKVHKVVHVHVHATLLRSAPSTNLMLTTSGAGALKHWTLAPDGTLKHGNMLPTAKESLDVYTDHCWLPSTHSQHRMIVLVDPDSSNDINRHRKQAIYIFEGVDNETASSNVPLLMELRQAIQLKLDPGCRAEKLVSSQKAFSVVGMGGYFAAFERTDDKAEPYVESRRLALGDKHLIGGCVYPSEEKMVLLTKQGRLLSLPLDATIEQIKKAMGGTQDDAESVHSKEDGHRSLVPMAQSGGISDMRTGGHHTSSILAADMAYERPLLVTVGADNTARVWNYLTGKCELVHYFRSEEPIAVAFHGSGFQFLVSFKDRIRAYNVLIDKIKPHRETVQKNCKCLKYSHGAQYFAAASAINVTVFETRTFKPLMTFQGHMMTVVKLCWAPGDQVLFSAGMDGNVYGWPVAQDGRMEVVSANNRSSAILDLVADCNSTVFYTPPKDTEDEPTSNNANNNNNNNNNNNAKSIAEAALQSFHKSINDSHRSWLIISSLDGHMRMPVWSMQQIKPVALPGHTPTLTASPTTATQALLSKFYPTIDNMPIVYGDSSISITALALSHDRTKLFVGTSLGCLRVYPWPPDPHACPSYTPPVSTTNAANTHTATQAAHTHTHGSAAHTSASAGASSLPITLTHATLCTEIYTHSSAVVSISLPPLENLVVSTAADGSVFVHTYTEATNSKAVRAGMPVQGNNHNHNLYDMDGGEDGAQLNDEVVLLALEDIEDHVTEVVELQKLLNETKAKNEFQARKLELDHNDAIRRVSELHDATLTKEKENFEKQRGSFDKRIRELMATIEAKESDHIKIINELENKYEHKLADQLERYDLLSEKMQLLKQKCEALLEAEKTAFEKQINDLKAKFNSEEKKYKLENKRAVEDKIANESALKEIINQQEDEYEDELRQLIQAAESELVSERDTILKLRTLVQTKNTKLDQLKKKLIELQTASKARLVMLNQEKSEKQKLLDTIEHYKKNLVEREDALAEKEKLVLELRSKTRTLENFRFVLDHRLQQLSSERGPITSHIEGLEKHISTMYEELVEEFSSKKAAQEASVLKDQKIQWISQDLNKMRANVREKEQTIAAFKRDLGNIISSMVVGKELEESVKMLYKKFVRGEGGGEKSSMKLNARVQEVIGDILHPPGMRMAGGGVVGAVHDLDDQSFLSTESQQRLITTGAHGTAGGHAAVGGGGHSKSLIRDIEEALVETAKEADRQKTFVERQAANLKHRLYAHKQEAHIHIRHRLHENSDLLFENNDLRMENKELHRKMNIYRQQVEELQRNVKDMHKSHASAAANPPPDTPFDVEVSQPAAIPPAASGEIAPWVIHNSLPGGTGAGNAAVAARRGEDLQPISAVAGQGLGASGGGVSVSQSTPNLLSAHRQQVLSKIQSTSASVLQGAGINILRNSNSKTITIPSPQVGAVGVGGKANGKMVEKLTKEVENLAVALDEMTRENALHKLEINKLNKQLRMYMSTHASMGSLGPGSGVVSADGGAAGGISGGISKIGGGGSGMFIQGEVLEEDSNILHADLYGYPSTEEKMAMRITGSSAPGSANLGHGQSRGLVSQKQKSRGNSQQGMRRSQSRSQDNSQPGEGGIINSLDHEQFSLQST